MQVQRCGAIRFGDASLHITEDGCERNATWSERQLWERTFKHEVFKRVLQQLNRLGWSCEVPQAMIKDYSLSFARNHRYCRKGDLQADLELTGRCIGLKMFQCVSAPDRPDHEGRYQSDKEKHMPYLMRLEMERTRRRIRKYLLNVFAGYEFRTEHMDGRSEKRGPGHLTAFEYVARCYETSWHFKGDVSQCTISEYNNKSADERVIEHGARVWGFDHKGRAFTGIAQYNINNMWWVVTGKYDVRNTASFELYVARPEQIRVKRNAKLRRSRLEKELSKAIACMNFRRAETLKNILFPVQEPLFLLYHNDHQAYHGPCFNGYTSDTNRAGKFTYNEVKGWADDRNKIVPMVAA